MVYKYKTRPFSHQREAFTKTANLAAYGLLWEPGTGKSKALIDTASYLFLEGKINAILVIAPNGVHRNWVSDEIPAHMPDSAVSRLKTLVWQSSKAGTDKFERKIKDLLRHEGLVVVVVAYEATITDKFKKFAKRLFAAKTIFMALDESHRIKTGSSKVKMTVTAMGKHAAYRRIATGTPVETPFDIYTQIRFLDNEFWSKRGFKTFEDFKAHFGIFVEQRFGGRSFEKCVSYRNLDELAQMVREITWRLTKEEAGLNLPPKVYTKRYCTLTPETRRVYDALRDSGEATLANGDVVSAEAAITKLLRLQQIACGYVACEAEQPIQYIDPKKNPRMDLTVDEVLADLPHQSIVFSRFTADIDELCRRLGKHAVRYDGQVGDDDRARAKKAFQRGDVKHFVMSEAGSEGITLIGSKTMVFYANNFKLIKRLQTEDRHHRPGQTESVTYIDIIAQDTVDEYIVKKLCSKFDVFTEVLQDDLRAWLQR